MAPSLQASRRPSLADSIEVVIIQTETSTYFPPPPPSSVTPWSHTISPSRSTSPLPTPILANFPVVTSAPFSHYHSDPLTPTPSSPPPNYSPSVLSTPHTTPLSFFPQPSTSVDLNAPPPPSYRTVPRTHAESMFWWGFLCPLIFWPLGILHFWRAERPTGFADLEAGEEEVEIRVALEEGMFGPGMQARCPSVKESLELWREEEKLWAKRCACSLVGFVVIGSVFIAVVVSVADLV